MTLLSNMSVTSALLLNQSSTWVKSRTSDEMGKIAPDINTAASSHSASVRIALHWSAAAANASSYRKPPGSLASAAHRTQPDSMLSLRQSQLRTFWRRVSHRRAGRRWERLMASEICRSEFVPVYTPRMGKVIRPQRSSSLSGRQEGFLT